MSITQQLKLFVDVVQQGSFAKAASLNNMDNSSLSKQVKKLEQHLGVQLLNRSTRSFSLTSAGEDILAEAINSLILSITLRTSRTPTNLNLRASFESSLPCSSASNTFNL